MAKKKPAKQKATNILQFSSTNLTFIRQLTENLDTARKAIDAVPENAEFTQSEIEDICELWDMCRSVSLACECFVDAFQGKGDSGAKEETS